MKPLSCTGCPLAESGKGWVPGGLPVRVGVGALPPAPHDLLFVGEYPGDREIVQHVGLVGPSGGLLGRLSWKVGLPFDGVPRHNALSCMPPKAELKGKWYEQEALDHCAPNLRDTLQAVRPKVVVALGGAAARVLLGLGESPSITQYHGVPQKSALGDFWVVPTFNPAHLLRGSMKLCTGVLWDLSIARKLLEGTLPEDPEPHLEMDPGAEWFNIWVNHILENHPDDDLAVDIETLMGGSDEGAISEKDASYQITRWNFSVSPDVGVTIPHQPQYEPALRRLLTGRNPKVFWHWRYDVRRIEAAGYELNGEIHDGMDAWHVLYSDLPRGLGYVAPFYSPARPWKHTAASLPAFYGAMDGVQTTRSWRGIVRDLRTTGMWDIYYNDIHLVDQLAFRPAEKVGLHVDRPALQVYQGELAEASASMLARMRAVVPMEARPLAHPLKRRPAATSEEEVVRCEMDEKVWHCQTCNKEWKQERTALRHKCSGTLVLEVQTRTIEVWRKLLPFNPASPPQLLALLDVWRLSPGKNRKTRKASVDKKVVDRLIRTAKPEQSQFFSTLKEWKGVTKTKSVYVDATLKALDANDRIHATFGSKPSTLRTNSASPNLQNVVGDKPGLAGGFRRCITAAKGCVLLEADYAAIEAILTGWFARDPAYIRLAKLGIHAYLAGHLLHRKDPTWEAPSLAWSDADLKSYFSIVKKTQKATYDKAKRCVHGTNYGLTPWGMVEQFPEVFPDRASAEEVQKLYFELAPLLARWQQSMQLTAERAPHKTVGGPGVHPFGYRHTFWRVFNYHRLTPAEASVCPQDRLVVLGDQPYERTLGDDAKRVVAFPPQSCAAGVIRHCALRLFKPDAPGYIGHAGPDGMTPLRAIIHDSFLLEVREELQEWVAAMVRLEMRRPVPQLPCPPEWGLGDYLAFDTDVKVGRNWEGAEVEGRPANPEGMRTHVPAEHPIALETAWHPVEDEPSEDNLLLAAEGLLDNPKAERPWDAGSPYQNRLAPRYPGGSTVTSPDDMPF